MTNVHETPPLLLDGVHHVAVLTSDAERLVDFYESVFGATVEHTTVDGAVRLTFLAIGPNAELNVFEIDGNDQATPPEPDVRPRQT